MVAFVDDDCEPRSDWVAAIGDAARRYPGCGLGGQVVNGLRENPYSETSQLIVTFLCRYYATGPTGRFFTSNNMAFPRDALRETGGFDVAYTRAAAEDRELCDRWVAGGRRLVAVPEAVVCHAHAMTGSVVLAAALRVRARRLGLSARPSRPRRGAGARRAMDVLSRPAAVSRSARTAGAASAWWAWSGWHSLPTRWVSWSRRRARGGLDLGAADRSSSCGAHERDFEAEDSRAAAGWRRPR